MKTKLLLILLLAGAPMFAGTHWGFSFGVGPAYGGYVYAPPPPPPPSYYYARPPLPALGYTWVGGYYYPVGRAWHWRAGYWARPPYHRGYWVQPRYHNHRYYRGYWRR